MADPNRHQRVDVRLKKAFKSRKFPKQLLICGPAGTGKTFSILLFIHLLARANPGLRILICRQTRVSLTESVLVTFEQEILPATRMEFLAYGAKRRGRSSYLYPNGSEIVLAGLDEPTRIGSTAWDLIYVNEAIELSEESWDTLGSRLDRPGRTRLGYLIGDTNPGDPSHWLKKRCDEGRTVLWDTTHAANVAMRDENGWLKAGILYLANLDRLRGTRRKRLKEGKWSAGEGVWFETFGEAHQTDRAEYNQAYPVHLAVDSGVHTGAVLFQVQTGWGSEPPIANVFGDYYAFNLPAYENACRILELAGHLCGGRFDRAVTDPAGKASTATGPTVIGEYHRAGFRPDFWPSFPGSVVDGLSLIESFVATDPPGLIVHPRCQHLINAFANYSRDKRGGQWIDRPKDPQHPHEDVMDALRGGLMDKFPEGRRPEVKMRRVHASQVF